MQEPKYRKVEYTVLVLDVLETSAPDLAEKLIEMGVVGWDLVESIPTSVYGSPHIQTRTYIFKRIAVD